MHRDAKYEASLRHRRRGAVTALRQISRAAVLIMMIGGVGAWGSAVAAGTSLNVVIPPFDAGVPADPATFRDLEIFPRIRSLETRLLPFQLAEQLGATGEWGAVRIVAEPDPTAELQVFGSIVRSDGMQVTLNIRVVDATGTEWFDRQFTAAADLPDERPRSAAVANEFESIYRDIASAMYEVRLGLDDAALRRIAGTALVRYARELAPNAFSEFLEQGDDGHWELLRMPAYGDPMLRRIELIRNTEFLITDTVDEKYRELNDKLARAYRVWRNYRRKFLDYEAENERFAAANAGDAPRGSWEAIKDQYDIYKYDRITVQERDRLALAFSNEVTPTIEAIETRIEELNAWVEQGYREWRDLLQQLDEVDRELGQ